MRQQPARSASAPRLQSAGLSAHHHQELSLLTKGLQCSSRQLLGQVNGERSYFYNLLFQDKKLPRAFLIFGVNSYSASHLYPSLFLSLCFLSFLFFFPATVCYIYKRYVFLYSVHIKNTREFKRKYIIKPQLSFAGSVLLL